MRIGKFEIDFSSYLWVLPFIGGLIAIISIITPAGFLEVYYYFEPYVPLQFWMWGMWINSRDYNYFVTSNTIFLEGAYLISGIISSIVIFCTGTAVVIDAFRVRWKKGSIESRRNLWSWCGILIWVATILWVIQISFTSYYDIMVQLGVWSGYSSPPSADLFTTPFWFYFKMDFGVIGPLIAGGLLLFTRVLTKR